MSEVLHWWDTEKDFVLLLCETHGHFFGKIEQVFQIFEIGGEMQRLRVIGWMNVGGIHDQSRQGGGASVLHETREILDVIDGRIARQRVFRLIRSRVFVHVSDGLVGILIRTGDGRCGYDGHTTSRLMRLRVSTHGRIQWNVSIE